MTTVSLGSTVVAAEGQVSSDLMDEVAILDFKAGMYYGLDSVGARVWTLIQEPRVAEEIRDVLVSEYEVEPDRCGRDLLALLQSLVDKNLAEVKSETST
jgi:hypothetical protein